MKNIKKLDSNTRIKIRRSIAMLVVVFGFQMMYYYWHPFPKMVLLGEERKLALEVLTNLLYFLGFNLTLLYFAYSANLVNGTRTARILRNPCLWQKLPWLLVVQTIEVALNTILNRLMLPFSEIAFDAMTVLSWFVCWRIVTGKEKDDEIKAPTRAEEIRRCAVWGIVVIAVAAIVFDVLDGVKLSHLYQKYQEGNHLESVAMNIRHGYTWRSIFFNTLLGGILIGRSVLCCKQKEKFIKPGVYTLRAYAFVGLIFFLAILRLLLYLQSALLTPLLPLPDTSLKRIVPVFRIQLRNTNCRESRQYSRNPFL